MEDYVSFKQAKALKELGFDWDCSHYYEGPNPRLKGSTQFRKGYHFIEDFYHDFNDFNSRYSQPGIPDCSAPTLAQAQKWLREVKNTIVLATCNLDYEKGHEWYWFVDKDFDIEDPEHFYDTYEQALSAGINAALELLK